MKLKSYKLLFRFFSYLSDKTNGAPLFVKYKLLLGTLIISFMGVSCSSRSQQVSCYDMTLVPDDSVNVAGKVDSIIEPEPYIMCYEVAAPIEPEEPNKKEDETEIL